MAIRHIVLITWKQDVSADRIDEWIKMCECIPRECAMVQNWLSGPCITGPDVDKPSTHDFGLMFDLGSDEEWESYLRHPYPASIYESALQVIDLDRTASTNMRLPFR